MVAAGEKRKIARPMVNNQPLVLAKPVPPGWKHRLYGRQDARRYGGGGRCARCLTLSCLALDLAGTGVSISIL